MTLHETQGRRRLLLGWAIFLAGLAAIEWLHTFRDSTPHQATLPLLILLWITLGVCLWDGCRVYKTSTKIGLILIQTAVAFLASAALISHLINQSLRN